MRKPLETRLLTFDFLEKQETGEEKAQFTTKLHFFALYQQNHVYQPGLNKFLQ